MTQDFQQKFNEIIDLLIANNNKYFKSKFHEFAFYLHLNNPAFDKELGITRVHMIDKEKALELCNHYKSIFKDIEPFAQYHNFDHAKIENDIDALYKRLISGL